MSGHGVPLSPEGYCLYLIHYTPLAERRAHLERELQAAGLERLQPRWILEHDREAFAEEDLQGLIVRGGGLGQIGGPLNAGHVSVILKHLEAFKAAAESEAPWHLVLEDDVVLDRAFLPKLERMLRNLPADWEIVFVGDGCRLHIPWWRRLLAGGRARKAGALFRGWKKTWWGGGGMSRCAAGYVIRPESARRFLSSKHAQPPFEVPIDWLMNRVGQELQFRSYWAEPPLARQGTFASWTAHESNRV